MTRVEFVKRLQSAGTLLRERARALRRREQVFGRASEVDAFMQELAELEVRVRGGCIPSGRVLRAAERVEEGWPPEDPVARAIAGLGLAYREVE